MIPFGSAKMRGRRTKTDSVNCDQTARWTEIRMVPFDAEFDPVFVTVQHCIDPTNGKVVDPKNLGHALKTKTEGRMASVNTVNFQHI
jgi:hypothetical protein